MTGAASLCRVPLLAGDRFMLQMVTLCDFLCERLVYRISLEFVLSSNLIDQILRRPGRRSVTRHTLGWIGDGIDNVTVCASRTCTSLEFRSVAKRTGTVQVSGVVVTDEVLLFLFRAVHVRYAFSIPVENVLFARVIRVKGGMGGPGIVAVMEGSVQMASLDAFTALLDEAEGDVKRGIGPPPSEPTVAPLAGLQVLLALAPMVDGKPPGEGRLQRRRMKDKGWTAGVTDEAAGNLGCPFEILSVTELAEEEVRLRLSAVTKAIPRIVDGFRDPLFGAGEATPDTGAKNQYEYQPRFLSQLLPSSSPHKRDSYTEGPDCVNKGHLDMGTDLSSPVRIDRRSDDVRNPADSARGVAVKARKEEIYPQVTEDRRRKPDKGQPRGAFAFPSSGDSSMQVRRVDQPHDQGPGLLGIPAPVSPPGGIRPCRTRDDPQAEQWEAYRNHAVRKLIQHFCRRKGLPGRCP
jgi:hypothetical protein